MSGLRQKLLAATSEDEVIELLNKGKTYEFASTKTRNSWKSAARRTLKQAPAPIAETEAAGEEYVPEKKKRRLKK